MDEVVMVTLDCPWCEAPVALATPDTVRCDGCSVEVAIDPPAATPPTAVAGVALAA